MTLLSSQWPHSEGTLQGSYLPVSAPKWGRLGIQGAGPGLQQWQRSKCAEKCAWFFVTVWSEIKESRCLDSGASPKLMFRPRLGSIYQTYLAWRVWPCGYHHISIWDIKFMLLNKFMTWKPDPCHWGFKMWTDEAICSESKRGWVTKLRTKAEPLSPKFLASAQGIPSPFQGLKDQWIAL